MTRILESMKHGDPKAADELLPLVYGELRKLAAKNQSEAELVKLRYFVGMTIDEAAEVPGNSARPADNFWAHARAWLYNEIIKGQGR